MSLKNGPQKWAGAGRDMRCDEYPQWGMLQGACFRGHAWLGPRGEELFRGFRGAILEWGAGGQVHHGGTHQAVGRKCDAKHE